MKTCLQHYFIPSLSPLYVRCARCSVMTPRAELGTAIVVHEDVRDIGKYPAIGDFE